MAGQNKKRLDLLLKEITDPYVQENFYKLKVYLENVLVGGSGGVQGPQGPQGPPGPPGDTAVNVESATKLKITRTAQEDILAGEVVRAFSDTHVSLATADSTRSDAMVLGIAEADALTGADVDVILLGVITDAAFAVFGLNDPLFLDVDGGITNVKRTSGYHVTVGKALGGNNILFQSGNPVVIA